MEISDNTETPSTRGGVDVRQAVIGDARHMWQMVRDCDVLDTNSCYAYLLICRDFSSTSLVAHRDEQIVGFVSAYVPPDRPEVLFVWQVAVHPGARKQGVARLLLDRLLATPAGRRARYLEATVTRSNTASRRLFASIASELGVQVQYTTGFTETDFGASTHEAEETVRIGIKRS